MSDPRGCVTHMEGVDPVVSSRQSAPELDSSQRLVVAHESGPLLVLAGPGTGKTTTIVEAVAHRMATVARSHGRSADAAEGMPTGHPPILVLTFGRAAADELRERIADRIGTGVLPTVSTFHAFSYAVLREFSSKQSFSMTPRLIDAADQDARLRELLTNAVQEGRVPWPQELQAAIGTQGLAVQVRELLARAQLLGFDDVALKRAAQDAGMTTWSALADFLGEYLDVLDASGVVDYSELIHRAVMMLQDPAVAAVLRRRYPAIYVDEYQDTDPAQVQLLQSLVSPDSLLVAVGDPDQAIYGFRGADVGGILRFRDDFPTASGEPAQTVVLRETRRFGPNIAQAAGRVIRRVGLGTLPVQVQREHRSPTCANPDPGSVEVVTFESEAAQAASIADHIRRARLTGQVESWSDMAVIVRSAVRQLPMIQHALESVGVPTNVAADELPLREHRAVVPLLGVLSLAADPTWLTIERMKMLLFSPLIAADGIAYRRLGRGLRGIVADLEEGPPPRSDEAVRRALIDDALWSAAHEKLPTDLTTPLARLRAAVAAGRSAIEQRVPVYQVLWDVWVATDWPQRLETMAKGSGAAARAANSDLDSILALFQAAARADEVFGIARPVQNFLRDMQAQSLVASTAPGTRSGTPRDAVDLLTAHRAKGLQWRRVFILGVQEESWPDLRSRPSLLLPDRLHADGIGDPPLMNELLEDERRLFYVACTRARESLTVTAVANAGQSPSFGEQPSRFLAEVAADTSSVGLRHEPGYQLSALSMSSVVASLRATLESDETSAALKHAAAERLAHLASQGVASADPANWWGIAEWTSGAREVRAAAEPFRVSGSSWAALDRCSLAWFLEHEARAKSRSGTAIAFGSVVHELADAVTRGDVPPDIDVLTRHLEEVWSSIGFESDWQQAQELRAAKEALQRFVDWHQLPENRRVVGSELKFVTEVEVPGDRVQVSGAVDRLQLDDDGQLHIFDLKTQGKKETTAKLAEHRQLQLYQLVAAEGAFDDRLGEVGDADIRVGSGEHPVADASLVLLRIEDRKSGLPQVQVQGAIDPEVVKRELAQAAELVRSEKFTPTRNTYCAFCSFQNVCPAQAASGEVVE